MAKDPTQGPVSTYDEFGNPIQTNVDPPVVEEVAEEEVAESAVEETIVEEEVEDSTEAEDIEMTAEPAAEPDSVEDAKLWDRLTETGAEGDPDGGIVTHVEFACDRCYETKKGMLFSGGTAGFYATDEELGWGKYANEGEEILCDACMQSDERYLVDYPDVSDDIETYAKVPESEEEFVIHEHEIKSPVTRDEAETMLKERSFLEMKEIAVADGLIPESSETKIVHQLLDHWFPPPPEEFVTHEHEIKAPLTYNEAETMLREKPFLEIRELAIADGLIPERSRIKVTYQLLAHWFPPSEAGSVGSAEEPQMSVRVRRAKGLM